MLKGSIWAVDNPAHKGNEKIEAATKAKGVCLEALSKKYKNQMMARFYSRAYIDYDALCAAVERGKENPVTVAENLIVAYNAAVEKDDDMDKLSSMKHMLRAAMEENASAGWLALIMLTQMPGLEIDKLTREGMKHAEKGHGEESDGIDRIIKSIDDYLSAKPADSDDPVDNGNGEFYMPLFTNVA